ncbi:MAG: sugar phosphate nucleotidyltransferase [bacterium]|nr:sugar phosphate nucleotidyltransferase [bacterium]
MDSSTKAIILSAGFATRMYPRALQTGKSLLPLGDRFVIDVQVDALMRTSLIGHLFVITNEKFYPVMRRWQENSAYKEHITLVSNGVSVLEKRKGAFGDLQYILENTEIDDDVLVLGNDNLFEDSLEPIIQFAKKQNAMTVSVNEFVKTNCTTQTNEVILNQKTFRVQRFHDKLRLATSPYYASFLYVIPRHQLDTIKDFLESQRYNQEPTNHFIAWALDHNYPFYGFPMSGRRFDTGDPTSYKNTQEWYRNKT